MSRTVAACGVLADAILGGISMFDGGEGFWLATGVVAGLSACSTVAFVLAEMMATSMDLPDVLPPLK